MDREVLEKWEHFYRTVCSVRTDFKDLEKASLESLPSPSGRLLIVPKGIAINHLFLVCQHHFRGAERDLRDFNSITSARRPYENYVIHFNGNATVDEKRKARYLDLTLEERLILELKHYSEYGAHFDVRYANLCLGSRYPDGKVPTVLVYDGKLYVGVPVPL